MDRIDRDHMLIAVAHVISARGTCDRNRVGAVIAREGRAVSWGYNGAPPGLPHCSENDHGWADLGYERQGAAVGCRNATHAEANALAFAARQGISTDGGTVYVTLSPCDVCARLLVAAGIERIVFDETYRDTMGLDLLYQAGVQVVCLGSSTA